MQTMTLVLRRPTNAPGDKTQTVKGVVDFAHVETKEGEENEVIVEYADGDSDTFSGQELTVANGAIPHSESTDAVNA